MAELSDTSSESSRRGRGSRSISFMKKIW